MLSSSMLSVNMSSLVDANDFDQIRFHMICIISILISSMIGIIILAIMNLIFMKITSIMTNI